MKLVNLFLRLPLLSSCLLLSPLSQLFNRHCVCQTHLDVQSRSSSTPKKGQTKPMFEMKGDEWVHDSDGDCETSNEQANNHPHRSTLIFYKQTSPQEKCLLIEAIAFLFQKMPASSGKAACRSLYGL